MGSSEWRRATGGTWEVAAGGAWRARERKGNRGKRVRKGQDEAGTSGSYDDCEDDGGGGGSVGEGGGHGAAPWAVPLQPQHFPG